MCASMSAAFMVAGVFECVSVRMCVCVDVMGGGGEMVSPIKRCPCCNQCTEALGPICCNINLELMKAHNTQTHLVHTSEPIF